MAVFIARYPSSDVADWGAIARKDVRQILGCLGREAVNTGQNAGLPRQQSNGCGHVSQNKGRNQQLCSGDALRKRRRATQQCAFKAKQYAIAES